MYSVTLRLVSMRMSQLHLNIDNCINNNYHIIFLQRNASFSLLKFIILKKRYLYNTK